jgi:hypothetical protein
MTHTTRPHMHGVHRHVVLRKQPFHFVRVKSYLFLAVIKFCPSFRGPCASADNTCDSAPTFPFCTVLQTASLLQTPVMSATLQTIELLESLVRGLKESIVCPQRNMLIGEHSQ